MGCEGCHVPRPVPGEGDVRVLALTGDQRPITYVCYLLPHPPHLTSAPWPLFPFLQASALESCLLATCLPSPTWSLGPAHLPSTVICSLFFKSAPACLDLRTAWAPRSLHGCFVLCGTLLMSSSSLDVSFLVKCHIFHFLPPNTSMTQAKITASPPPIKRLEEGGREEGRRLTY